MSFNPSPLSRHYRHCSMALNPLSLLVVKLPLAITKNTFSPKNAFSVVFFDRLLKRNYIQKLVLLVRIGCVALSVLLVALMIRGVIISHLATSNEISKWRENIRLALTGATSEPNRPKTRAKTDPAVLAAKSIFGPLATPAPVKTMAPTPKPQPSTQFLLMGVFLEDGREPYAIIEEKKKGEQDAFKRGERIFGEATLVVIRESEVEIERNGTIETLSMDDTPDRGSGEPKDGAAGIQQTSSEDFVVDEAELDKALENLPLLLTQARAVPYFKEGRAVGLRMFAIKSGSMFERLGILNGDVLKSINGNSMADLTQALQLLQKLKDERSISLTVERNLADKELRYQIR